MSQSTPRSILNHFAALQDPRQCAKVLYPLREILLLALAATIAGADDFVEVTLWGEQHQAFLRRFLPYEFGIPSHDTMCDVFAAVDALDLDANIVGLAVSLRLRQFLRGVLGHAEAVDQRTK